eukprot:SAG22_NODE_18304_length_289_cov_1.084211_1_plen_72_part_00
MEVVVESGWAVITMPAVSGVVRPAAWYYTTGAAGEGQRDPPKTLQAAYLEKYGDKLPSAMDELGWDPDEMQ